METIRKVLVCVFAAVAIASAVPAAAIDLPAMAEGINAADSVAGHSAPKMDAGVGRVVMDYNQRKTVKALSLKAAEDSKGVIVEAPDVVNGRITVYLDLKNREDIKVLRAKYDLDEVVVTNFSDTVQASVLVEDIEKLASEDAVVKYIRVPSVAVKNIGPDIKDISSVMTSKGVAEIQADSLHKKGIIGNGVDAAIIDMGFAYFDKDPEIRNIIREAKAFRRDLDMSGKGEIHGTICCEIFCDVCYGNLSLYAVETSIEFAKAVEHIIDRGDISVIFCSLSFFEGVPRQDSISSKAVEKARDSGIIFVAGAGNFKNCYYESEFIDTDGDGWHEFSQEAVIDETQKLGLVKKGETLGIDLSWFDARHDYDLYLLEETTELREVVCSNFSQTEVDMAREGLRITMNRDAYIHIAIHKRDSGNTKNTKFELFTLGAGLQYITPGDSVTSPAAAKRAVAVGAIAPGSRDIQDYSSQGNISFVGISPVLTWATEPYLFGGTSAATPLVAGAFALLISAYPKTAIEEIQTAMEQAAVDLGDEGWDQVYGWGLPQVQSAYYFINDSLPQLPQENYTIQQNK